MLFRSIASLINQLSSLTPTGCCRWRNSQFGTAGSRSASPSAPSDRLNTSPLPAAVLAPAGVILGITSIPGTVMLIDIHSHYFRYPEHFSETFKEQSKWVLATVSRPISLCDGRTTPPLRPAAIGPSFSAARRASQASGSPTGSRRLRGASPRKAHRIHESGSHPGGLAG